MTRKSLDSCRMWWVPGLLLLFLESGLAQDTDLERLVEQMPAKGGPTRHEFHGDTGGLTVRHLNAAHPCCLELSPEVSLEDGRLTITEFDESPPCLCPPILWDLEIRLPALDAGDYDVYLMAPGDLLLATARVVVPESETFVFTRGEVNADGSLDIADPVFLLQSLFAAGGQPPCADMADANDDGAVDISDAVFLLEFLFLGGDPPPSPFPESGEDPTEDAIICSLENTVSAIDFARDGDVDGDGSVGLSDAVSLLNHISLGGPAPVCEDAADMDDDGRLTLADVMLIFPDPIGPLDVPAPGVPASVECGPDPTPDALGCLFSECPS